MRGGSVGVKAYARPRTAVGSGRLAAMAGAAALGAFHPALAAEATATDDADAATQVSPVYVEGKRNPLDVDTGLNTMLTTVQDTPQAISVIGAVQLKAQGVTSLEQALRNVPGITIAIGEGGTLSGDQFKIRGFDAKDDVYIDGLRDFGAYTRDSFNYEEVQVLKGPSGAMFGRGTTGGAINTISKRPRLEDFVGVDGYLGNGDYYRALGDINHKLGATTAVRLSLMANDTGVVDRDHIYTKRWGTAVTLATGIGTDTTASVSYLHQHSKGRPDYGIVIVQRPGDIVAKPASEYGVGVERSTFTGYLNDVDRNDADILTVRLAHKVNDKISLNSDTRYGSYNRYFQYSTLDQCTAACTAALFDGNPATEPFGGNGGQGPYDSDAWGLQNITTARIDYDIGGFKNQLILGADLSRQENTKVIFAYALPPGLLTRPAIPRPLVNPNPNFPAGYQVFRAVPGSNIACVGTANCTTVVNGVTVSTNTLGTATEKSRGESTDAGVFLTDRLFVSDRLSIIGSYRLDRYTAELQSLFFNNSSADIKVKSTLKSPRISGVFEPTPDQTYYVSWGRSQTPQGTSIVGAGAALAVTTKDLAPENSRIWEAGAKFAVPHTQLAVTASVFDIKKDNALQVDPATGFLQAQSGERQQVKGIELGLSGRITPAWTVSAGYSYLHARIKESFTNCAVAAATATGTPTGIVCPVGVTTAIPVLNQIAVGRQVTFVPKTSATFFTTYDFSALVDGLSAGGDVTYQSKTPVGYTARSVSFNDRASQTALRLSQVPHSVTLDAYVAYKIGAYRFAVNLYNLADRTNYTQIFGNRAAPAAGRTVILSAGAVF
ncbi:TonB-dependent receptor [Phenylobacterium sp.]|uniref:TonB-dependent receptor n=1 Tax=Phenylobacterium sp. TaxID=1871053 RepID=UPI0025E4761F|nr:TonB-dependent receptor [Phenylobacterium sp.]